nr:SDR family oxidoreductase [Thiocapsa imhoffii]
MCLSGGTSGIGAALVAAFLAAGDRVVTCGRDPRKVAALAQTHEQASQSGALRVLVGDVTDAAFRSRLVAALSETADRLDLLINNAGVILGQGDLEETVADWQATLEVNLIAPFALTQACADLLARSVAPCVINLTSACAQHPFESCTSGSYSASKAGLDMLTRRLAMALAPRGIRVNAIAPGVVESPMWGDAGDLARATAAQRHRLGGDPICADDIAQAALFLASSQARRITGSILTVDAGYGLG